MKKIKLYISKIKTGVKSGAIWLGEISWDFNPNHKVHFVSITIFFITLKFEIWRK